jgi:RimJ/RimL family protein N-acetyltransferase
LVGGPRRTAETIRRMTYHVRRAAAEDWQDLRTLRLEALQDTPIGFGELYADSVGEPDEFWQERTRRSATSSENAMFVATGESGDWVGMAGGFASVDRPGSVVVYAVYVSPAHRGRPAGVAGLLIDAVIDWGRGNPDIETLRLDVHEDNERARTFYRRHGFTETGAVQAYAIDPSRNLIEMHYKAFR